MENMEERQVDMGKATWASSIFFISFHDSTSLSSILSLFDLLFLHIFSLFNLLFFRIFHIFFTIQLKDMENTEEK
jgi:hypothetical protein